MTMPDGTDLDIQQVKSSSSETDRVLGQVNRRLRRLTISVNIMTLFTILLIAIVYGQLGDHFGGFAMFASLSLVITALVGFAVGWFSRKLCEKP